jgi:uncharacterized protein YutE (UPF0331/DUF86 family)
LQELQKLTYEEFAQEPFLQASAERYFHVAIQAALDIGSMILAERSVNIPADYLSQTSE